MAHDNPDLEWDYNFEIWWTPRGTNGRPTHKRLKTWMTLFVLDHDVTGFFDSLVEDSE
jgi:hypothetical protein